MTDRRASIDERIDELSRRIGEEELSFTSTRSGGPGGQSVNKVATRVELLFDVANSPSLTAAEKTRLRNKLAGRLSKNCTLRIVSSRFRTQLANRRAARSRFYKVVAEALHVPKIRKRTTTPRKAHERRLNDKQRRAAVKKNRTQRPIDE